MSLEIPRFLRSAGFDHKKIVWFAGLHENTDNRHIHFSFFESEPSTMRSNAKGAVYSNGKIKLDCFERFRVSIEQRFTDLSAQIALARKDVTEINRNLLFSKESNLKYRQDLQDLLKSLADSLPKSGRLSYDSQNMAHLKPEVKKIVNCIIKSNKRLYANYENYCTQVKEKDATILKILNNSKIRETEYKHYLVADKYLEDIYRRLGNQVIGAVKVIKDNEKQTRGRLANKHIRRRTIADILTYSLRLNSAIEREAETSFKEFLERLSKEEIHLGEYRNELD
jgi:uncharacterized coiled-coil protein SlyX